MDIADKLALSSASVHNMMDTFLVHKLIKRGKFGEVYLTGYGMQMADKFERYYEKIEKKLLMNIEPCHAVDKAICAFMAEIPEGVLDEL